MNRWEKRKALFHRYLKVDPYKKNQIDQTIVGQCYGFFGTSGSRDSNFFFKLFEEQVTEAEKSAKEVSNG